MAKITFIGAGSTVFAKNLIGDILSFPELRDLTLTLFDVNEERLHTSEIVACRIAEFFGAKPKIEATLDRRRALDGADYAISMIQVGGYRPGTVTVVDDCFLFPAPTTIVNESTRTTVSTVRATSSY